MKAKDRPRKGRWNPIWLTHFIMGALLVALAFSPSAALAQQAPAVPTSVKVTRTDGTLTATWPSVDGAATYHVTYTDDGGASWSLAALDHPASGGGTERITIQGVDNAKTYIVGVRARNAHGDSGWRNSAPAGPHKPEPTPTPTPTPSPTPTPPAPPDAVASVTVTRGNGTLTVSWPAAARAESYHVTYIAEGDLTWSLAALNHPDTGITIDGVDNARTYAAGVRARNAGGDSGWRNSPAAAPYTPATPPAAPTGLTAAAGAGSVTPDVGRPSELDHHRVRVPVAGGAARRRMGRVDGGFEQRRRHHHLHAVGL